MRITYSALRPASLICLIAVSAASQAAMPTHSFLVRPVNSDAELTDQVATTPVVMDRYERHFAMTHAQVLAFLGTLHVARLTVTKVYDVYLAREDGSLDMKPQLLKAGCKVFADASGKAILCLICGNPMVPPRAQAAERNTPGMQSSDKTDLAELPNVVVATEAAASLTPTLEPMTEDVPDVPVVASTSVGTSAQAFGGSVAGLGSLFAFLPLIGASGGSGGTTPQIPTVPEPASIAALAIGATALMARRKRSR